MIELGCMCHLIGYNNKRLIYVARLSVHLEESSERFDTSLLMRILEAALMHRIYNKGLWYLESVFL